MSQISMKKPLKRPPLRRKRADSGEDDVEELNELLTSTKELIKLRNRPKGIDATKLDNVKPVSTSETGAENTKTWSLQSGGMIDMKTLAMQMTGESKTVGTSFSKETNRRDDDDAMLKYVEEEMQKRFNKSTTNEDENEKMNKGGLIRAEDLLPEHMKQRKTEEMISSQMLSGIPEVDLGLETKLKNIEETERAKQVLLKDMKESKNPKVSEFVPKNMAVNFVQHNRFSISDPCKLLNIETKNPELDPNEDKMPRVKIE